MTTKETSATKQGTAQPTANTQVKKMENISEQVLARINMMQETGDLVLPQDYSVENHIKAAWLDLQEITDRSGKKALTVCTQASIANALLDMVLQGLSVSKSQGYFIVYGNELQFQPSYFGTIAIAKRVGGIKREPVANVIYEGDEFVYSIDPETGLQKIVKHEQRIENIDKTKIKGAYAIVTRPDDTTELTIMSWAQIQQAWQQGATKGNSPAHKNFAEEMAKKSVINRALKTIINSSDDAWLYQGHHSDAEKTRNDVLEEKANKQEIADFENADYEDVTSQAEGQQQSAPSEQQEQPRTQPITATEQQLDMSGTDAPF